MHFYFLGTKFFKKTDKNTKPDIIDDFFEKNIKTQNHYRHLMTDFMLIFFGTLKYNLNTRPIHLSSNLKCL